MKNKSYDFTVTSTLIDTHADIVSSLRFGNYLQTVIHTLDIYHEWLEILQVNIPLDTTEKSCCIYVGEFSYLSNILAGHGTLQLFSAS